MKRILIVDDEERICQSLTALLGREGYVIETATDGEAAIAKLGAVFYDVILSDIKMPKADGMTVLKKARQKDPETLVILMTGYASLESAIAAVSAGAYEYILKPVDIEDLKRLIKRAVDKREVDLGKRTLMVELSEANQRLKREISQKEALYQAALTLSSSERLDDLLERIVTLAAGVLGAKVGSIMLLDPERKYLSIRAALGLSPEVIETTRLEVGASIAGQAALTGQPIWVQDLETDPRFARASLQKYETKSLLTVPLKLGEKVLGVLNLADKKDASSFSEEDLNLLSAFASLASLALSDAQNYQASRAKVAELSALYQIATRLSSLDRYEEMTRVVVETLGKLMEIETGLWFTYDPEKEKLYLASEVGQNHRGKSAVLELPLPKTEAESRASFRPSLSARIRETYGADMYFLLLPLFGPQTLDGVLALGRSGRKKYTEEEERLASIVTSQAATVFERQRAILNAARLVTMGNMMTEITHDLKKPLTNVRGGLQILRDKWDELDEKDKILASLEQEAMRLSDMVKELLDFSNPRKYQRQPKNLADLVRRALKLIEGDLAKKNIRLEFSAPDDLPRVLVNENEIVELILNMVLNALESIPDGKRISIALVPVEKGVEKCVRLTVSDEGAGIAPENLSRIFERYFTTKDSGTGLGLAIVDRIVKAHGGRIDVDSTPGVGTTFKIDFPY
ncbi:MAG: GAF domain-containing protein [candidate division Zixibacteria bacterium]|nr:GAF domain-containing protein [candidate division Zixibacteria bacterium]MCI0595760.1 GAF domain-containing protein [candidate division Zixibacteria bacterium]